MDYNSIIKDTQDIYFENQGNRINEDAAVDMIRGLLSVPDTELILHSSPRHLLQIVLEHDEFNGRSTFSCDILQLRNILQNKKIQTPSKVILFSSKVADRVLKQQKCRLVLNVDPTKILQEFGCSAHLYGGMAIVNTHSINIENLLHCIIVDCKDYQKVKTVEKIVADTDTKCDVYTDSNVPGIDHYKFASDVKKYIVNLPTLGIMKRIVRAKSKAAALELELARRWDYHPDSKVMKKPDNYKAEFWINSPFFDAIVMDYKQTKKAAFGDGFTKGYGEHGEDDFVGEWNGQNIAYNKDKSHNFAVMDMDGNIFLDTTATMHGDVVENLDLEPAFIVDGGFVSGDVYIPGMSNGGWSYLESEDRSVFMNAIKNRIRSKKPQVKIRGFNYKKSNITNNIKAADASSGSTFGTGGRLSGEGSLMDYEGVRKMIYRNPGAASSVRQGDRYRLKGGMAFDSDESIYVVQKVWDNKATLYNNKGKKHIVDIAIGLPHKFIKL